MPKVTVVQYEGSDEQITRILTQVFPTTIEPPSPRPTQPNGSTAWDQTSVKFQQFLAGTAAAGRPAQNKAMLAWLKAKDGEIKLTNLWNAAGVANQHDYAGVGGSLTKNMVKAGGPRRWYEYRVEANEWLYKIVPELLEPLRRAFGVKG